ncbi:hypothetical protein [Oleidesulfovibrio alaskensis]|uniref:hypothetical protein n=1 Tax=Oleidesulfovibrio alaskensis TaxID=58180 RepID=UPI0003FDFD74|nr:hypothetical protein [Oleidesulfovibrio alaskensis]
MARRCGAVLSLLAFLLLGAAGARAESEHTLKLNLESAYTAKADLDDGGSFARTSTRVRATWNEFSFFYRNDNYDWSDTSGMRFGRDGKTPFENLQRIGVMYNDTFRISGPWFTTASLGITSMFEEDFVNDNLTFFGGGMVGYAFSPQASVAAGIAGIRTPLKTYAFPMFSARYAEGPWTLQLGFPKTEARYAVSEALDVRLAADYDIGVYRLRDHSPLAKEGFLEMREIITGLYLDWKPLDGLVLSAGPELVWGRSMKVYDDNENRRWDKQEPDAAAGGRISISYSF